jgi:hypothetical protein
MFIPYINENPEKCTNEVKLKGGRHAQCVKKGSPKRASVENVSVIPVYFLISRT